jgi:hypothetical protein
MGDGPRASLRLGVPVDVYSPSCASLSTVRSLVVTREAQYAPAWPLAMGCLPHVRETCSHVLEKARPSSPSSPAPRPLPNAFALPTGRTARASRDRGSRLPGNCRPRFAPPGTRGSADAQSGLTHPRPCALWRRPVAGTLTAAATAVWPRTNGAGPCPIPVRGRARSRRPWWQCPHWTEGLPPAGSAWAKPVSPSRLVWILWLPGRGHWVTKSVLCSSSCF